MYMYMYDMFTAFLIAADAASVAITLPDHPFCVLFFTWYLYMTIATCSWRKYLPGNVNVVMNSTTDVARGFSMHACMLS